MIIFFHIPKCAGTTVEEGFSNHFGSDRVKAPATIDDYRVIPPHFLEPYQVLAGHITHDYALPYITSTSILLTLLREPAARLRSLYNYYRTLNDDIEIVRQAKQLSFARWLDTDCPEVTVMVENAIIRSFTPESYWRVDAPACPELIVSYAIRFLKIFDSVGFVEDIGVFLLKVRALTGVEIPNVRANSSSVDCTTEVSDEEMAAWLTRNSALDLELLRAAKSISIES
jgi:hypothetical protein